MTDTAESIPESTVTESHSTPLTIGVEAYISQTYARAEGDKLWSKVWQQVGRVEEIPKVGDFLTYEILDESVIIVRSTPDTISAYHNVCSHRGRRLVDTPPGAHEARGQARQFICGFHGWRYDLDGKNTFAAERQDWPCGLTEESTKLRGVTVDTWGGWIWINMDPGCEPLRDYLEPAASLLDHFHLENMRYRWRKWLVFDCNWKVALEAFMETYHVPYTHPEFMNFGNFLGWSRAQGKHSNIGYDAPKGMEENQAKLRIGSGADPRKSTIEMQNFTWENANTNTTRTLVDAAQRLIDELPEGTPSDQVLRHWLDSARRDDEARGVIWPTVDPQVVAASGTAWQIFPNFQIGHALNNMLCYSARPYGDDPNKCIFEAAVYELFPAGEEPETEWEFTPPEDPAWRTVLPQDFVNMAAVQKGMKSQGFSGPKPNPYRERSIVNLHHNLATYMGTGAPVDFA
ncbi:aromatic ring-hydroxylating dioxygenase subunit alpha [Rhodococcus sp. AD45-ID]|uniref:aromatic ring-hydroxylating oxygenase subunit alpha n=1 Tax=unclassified Rhodococcus (in: high G+C Gram-positive bacteria) TaxID=192944 RepID=UPI0005D3AA6C|nr:MULTISPECIES: aromatic ring-hydroxylating dioxygenase subunit alpha [unclassified Rhodococcus (in: high G+C Gram-positive bacteria)]KJF19811.1 Biphenyl dioxygenase subunit alpha [Rhodococcus sp. AD45]PSR40972.1 aromatic ring-hydroxylating dioxygenase subunit alpha [Rhodococcus sp. AD45-ID]